MKTAAIETIDLEKQMEDEDFRTSFFQWDEHEERKVASAKVAIEEAIAQGKILNNIKAKHGREGFLAFCKGKNLSERQGYYYVSLAENQDNDFLRALTFTQATRILPLVNEEGVTSDKDGLTLPDGTRLNIEDIQKMSARDIERFKKEYRAAQSKVDSSKKRAAEVKKHHDDEVNELVEKIEELEKECEQLKVMARRHPLEADIDDVFALAIRVGEKVSEIMNSKEKFGALEKDVTRRLMEKLNNVFHHLHSIVEANSGTLTEYLQ